MFGQNCLELDVGVVIQERYKSSQCSNLSLLQLPQPPDGGPDAGRGDGGVVPGTTSNDDTAVLVVAEPDTNSLSLHLILSTEGAEILAVLGDLHLLDGLPQAGSVPGAVLAGDPNLLGTLGHLVSLTSLVEVNQAIL